GRALAEARDVDEVKDVRDKAAAMQIYARQTKDHSLIDHATEIRLRAEIRAGELLNEMSDKGERQKPGDNPQGRNSGSSRPLPLKVCDMGVTKSQWSRWQQLAALPREEQERKIELAKKKASSAMTAQGGSKRPASAGSPDLGVSARCRLCGAPNDWKS